MLASFIASFVTGATLALIGLRGSHFDNGRVVVVVVVAVVVVVVVVVVVFVIVVVFVSVGFSRMLAV